MKKTAVLFLFIALILPPLSAQAEKEKPAWGISFSGFIKTDIFLDSRQTVSLREGHFLLFPKGPALDPDGDDTNGRKSLNILSVQTRLAGKVAGPDALGAKTSGLIEAEFFGTSDADVNGFRLRHAFVRLNWKRTEILIGQFWHPLFVTESYPDVVSFNTGAPFQPFNRSPQVRITRFIGRFSLAATALAQRDFASNGPEGAGSQYLRNAALPEFNLKLQYGSKNEASQTECLMGAGVNFLRIAPRLTTETGVKTEEVADGLAGLLFAKVRTPALTIKAEGVYGGNLHHLTMLGGYGVQGAADPAKKTWDYAALKTLALWAEIHTNGTRWQAGLFAGYSKNLGASQDIKGPVYSRGSTIARLVRISPRLVFSAGKLRLAAESEWTAASYGTPDSRGTVKDAKNVGNLRILLATYYFF